jgi:hypothetical protein
MKNYKLLIINGSGAHRAIFKKRLQRRNKALRKIAKGVKNLSVGCKFHLSFIINHLKLII